MRALTFLTENFYTVTFSASTMSLFKKKAPKIPSPPAPTAPPLEDVNNTNGVDNNNGAQKSQLVFHCQQAHGSPLGLISGFSNVKELYQKIAECYDFPPEDVSFFCSKLTLS